MLPFHRRRERARERGVNEKWDSTAPSTQPKSKRLVRFIIDWIKVSWKDVLAMAVLGAASLAIYRAPLAPVRNFPITFSESGDIVYPEFAYPERGWVISPALSGVLASVIPIGIIILAQIRIRSFWDMNNGILGVLYSLIVGSLFQVIIKQLIGGFRPYFLAVCQPDISRAAAHNTTGLNGVGFQNVMYTVDVCTNPDKDALKTAMTSFPSGHATTAFAGFIFLFLWMNAKLKVWANHRASFYWLALLFAPLLGAVLQACALTVDQAHNWYDILAGAAIGTAVAFASYRALYAAVWDWRFNHIPLMHRSVVDYANALTPEYMERAVWTRKLGWGRRKKTRINASGAALGQKRASQQGAVSPRSSATYARNGSTSVPSRVPAPVPYPDTAARGAVRTERRVAGDEMV